MYLVVLYGCQVLVHCKATSLVNRLVTMLLTGYQLVVVYQLKAGQMSWASLVTRLVTS